MLIIRSQGGFKAMKNNQAFMLNPQAHKYVPTPEGATLILNYFVYNNFQDFNTWQQIARTKVEYDYYQTPKGGFGCKIVLKWEERTIPTLIQSAEAKSKRSAKKRALKKLIETIINQGYIAHGFKEDNFVEKLPRRRKNSSDQSEQDHQEQRFPDKVALLTLLKNGQYEEVFRMLSADNPKWKAWEVLECWKHGLSIKSTDFCRKVLRAYRGQHVHFSSMSLSESTRFLIWSEKGVKVRQFSYGKLVNDPLTEELTDFIRYQQLQKSFTSRHGAIRQAALQIRPIPSENILKEMKNPIPSRQQLTSYFHPIEGRKIFLSSLEKRQSFFQSSPLHVEVPKFESEEREFTLKIVELLYGLLPYYCLDYPFIEEIAGIMREEIKNVEIAIGQNEQKYQEKGIAYYLNFKNLLTTQFCYLLNGRLQSNAISIQGMATPFRQQDQVFLFACKEPEEILNKKLNRRGNFNEFEEMQEISMNEMVALISTLDRRVVYVGQIMQLTPSIKIYIPDLSEDITDPEPLTMVKIYNSKVFEKTSSSIIKAARSCMKLIEENTTIIWQPPSFPVLSVMAELLIQWQIIKSTVLIVSLDAQALQTELTAQGFKVVRVTPKTQEKVLAKCSIVIAQPASVCCQLLRNYAFTRVIIENAHEISEVSILHSLVKGCKELFLIGDPFMPRMQVSSPYCQAKDMAVSLIERLHAEGRQTETYFSRFENCCQYRNVMEWADKFLYSGKLMLFGNENQTPIIKGFPWPSLDYRVCFLQIPSSGEQTDCLERQSYLCSAICAQVIKSGYTKIQQITCSAAVAKLVPFLQKRMGVLLRLLGYNQAKLFTKHMSRLSRVVSGSVYYQCDLSVMMLGCEQGLSFRELLGAMREGRRGAIIMGDMALLQSNPDYMNFLDWCKEKKLINIVDLRNFPILN